MTPRSQAPGPRACTRISKLAAIGDVSLATGNETFTVKDDPTGAEPSIADVIVCSYMNAWRLEGAEWKMIGRHVGYGTDAGRREVLMFLRFVLKPSLLSLAREGVGRGGRFWIRDHRAQRMRVGAATAIALESENPLPLLRLMGLFSHFHISSRGLETAAAPSRRAALPAQYLRLRACSTAIATTGSSIFTLCLAIR